MGANLSMDYLNALHLLVSLRSSSRTLSVIPKQNP